MGTEDQKKIDWLKYLNTGLLTFISIILVNLSISVNQVKVTQQTQQTELMRIKTIQDANTGNIANLTTRVNALEITSLSNIKDWVDINFVRKSDK